MTKCKRCGRKLTDPVSVRLGRGKTCQQRHLRDVTRDFKPEQVEKARDAILEGAIAPFRGQVFMTLSSDGETAYKTAPMACTCPSGVYRGYHRCWHQLAVEMLT